KEHIEVAVPIHVYRKNLPGFQWHQQFQLLGMLSEHSRAVIDKQAIGRCFISHEHVQMAITVEVSQFDSLGGVIYLWQVLAGTVDKQPGASRVVDPQKVLPFLARITNYH